VLRDYPERERRLWLLGQDVQFETGVAARDATSDDLNRLLAHEDYHKLLGAAPRSGVSFQETFVHEGLLQPATAGRWHVTNLGAVLFARDLGNFGRLRRKSMRVIQYRGNSRMQTVREYEETRGYAAAFTELVEKIHEWLPTQERIGRARRTVESIYPPLAIRELVANALIHQDFTVQGSGPMVEIFEDRVEITNPGKPLIDTLRFVDHPPKSRNDVLASLMRRLSICEERGSGIDKVIFEVERNELPAPEIGALEDYTRVVLFAPRELTKMSREERTRACYLHACLRFVNRERLVNSSLRTRMGIADQDYPLASRMISDTVKAGLIKLEDPENRSRKYARYLPFWA